MINNINDIDDLKNNPNESYNQWHKKVYSDENLLTIDLKDWHKNALNLSPSLNGLKILEVGCGIGDFALYLSKNNEDISAVDFSSYAIRLAKRKAKAQNKKVNFMVADAQNLPFLDNSFDVIFSCECLEHSTNPEKTLVEFNRVLKTDGELIVTTENYSNALVLWWIKSWILRRPFDSGAGIQPIEHFFLFWYVRKMLKKAGFKVQKMIGSHHVFLVLPKVHPFTFVKEWFNNKFAEIIFRPLARHMAFKAMKQ